MLSGRRGMYTCPKVWLTCRGRNHRLPGYRGIDLGRGLNFTVENTRSTRWRSAKDEGELSSSRSKYLGGLFNRDEIDMSFLVATRWIVPASVAASGVLVLLCICRIRQKRRRQRRASGSNRSA